MPNEFKKSRKSHPPQGEVGPLGREKLPRKKKTPTQTTPFTHQTKEHPHPASQGQPSSYRIDQERVDLHNCVAVSNSKWLSRCPFYKRTFLAPHTWSKPWNKTLTEQKLVLDLLDHPLSCCLGVHDELIPNKVFNLILVPLFMVEHLVVALSSRCSIA